MTNQEVIETLLKIRHEIMSNDMVTDTLWIGKTNETVVEAIEGLLMNFGFDPDDEDFADKFIEEIK